MYMTKSDYVTIFFQSGLAATKKKKVTTGNATIEFSYFFCSGFIISQAINIYLKICYKGLSNLFCCLDWFYDSTSLDKIYEH